MKARVAAALVVVAGFLSVTTTTQAALPLRTFSYMGTGTNQVTIQTGELRETWSGRAKPFGSIRTHVAGWIERPDASSFVVHASMVVTDRSGDVLIGACTGTGILPNPSGQEDWMCDATGGIGKFEASTGNWKLHIEIHRVRIQNGIQSNAFTETGSGHISWQTKRR